MNGKKLYKSRDNRMISGVCAGIAEYFNMDPTMHPSGLGAVQPAGRQRRAGLYHRRTHRDPRVSDGLNPCNTNFISYIQEAIHYV